MTLEDLMELQTGTGDDVNEQPINEDEYRRQFMAELRKKEYLDKLTEQNN